MSNTCDRNALRRCRTGDTFSAGKDLARAHATTPDRGVAHEERLQACRGPPFQSSRRLGRCRLSGPGSRAEQNAVLHVGVPMVSRVSSLGLSPRRARGPTCAWSSRASGRISSRPIQGAKYWLGRNSSQASNAWWRPVMSGALAVALPARARRAALVARADDHWPSVPRLLRACGYAEHRSEETSISRCGTCRAACSCSY